MGYSTRCLLVANVAITWHVFFLWNSAVVRINPYFSISVSLTSSRGLRNRSQKLFFIRILPSRELRYPIKKALLKMIFLFPRWDMLTSGRVSVQNVSWTVSIIPHSNLNGVPLSIHNKTSVPRWKIQVPLSFLRDNARYWTVARLHCCWWSVW